MATLCQEGIRRMANTGRDVPQENRVKILDKYMEKLTRSGYNEKVRGEILNASMNGYYNKVIAEAKGGMKVNRAAKDDRAMRKIQKVINKDKWHTKQNDENKEDVTKVKHRGNGKHVVEPEIKVNKNKTTEFVFFSPIAS